MCVCVSCTYNTHNIISDPIQVFLLKLAALRTMYASYVSHHEVLETKGEGHENNTTVLFSS